MPYYQYESWPSYSRFGKRFVNAILRIGPQLDIGFLPSIILLQFCAGMVRNSGWIQLEKFYWTEVFVAVFYILIFTLCIIYKGPRVTVNDGQREPFGFIIC